MSEFINKNAYVGDTGKQLKDIKTNADNINNKQDKLSTYIVNISTSYSHIRVYRYGNIVSIDIDGAIQESSGIIATDLPKAVYNWTYLKGLYGDAYLRVDSDGKLYISGHTAGQWLNIHGVYICQ